MRLLVLCGPTATGKTAAAVEAAHRLGVEVLSADSRQVYRGLDLGTGKDLEEFRRPGRDVRYHLIDIAEPEEVYTLFQYQADCYRTIASLDRGRRLAVLVGGTGLYLEAVLRRYSIANVPENPAFRAEMESRGHADLVEELRRRDPDLAARTDATSKKRVIRALEVAEAGRAGTVEHSRPPERPFTFVVFATALERAELRRRIDARLERRLKDGLVEEVEGLLRRGLSPDRLRQLGMEYREVTAYLRGEKQRERMIEDLRHEIHLLAKRQETYFRGMEKRGVPIRWIGPGEDAAALLSAAAEGGEA